MGPAGFPRRVFPVEEDPVLFETATRKRILIVDDDPAILGALSLALEDEYDIQTCRDGANALSLLPLLQPDLILLDLKMKGLDGILTLHAIRRAYLTLPVIIVTGWSTKEWAERAADLGVSGYLKKPLDMDQLARRLAEVLRTNDQTPPAPPASLGLSNEFVRPVVRRAVLYLHRNFSRKVTLREVAAAADVTPFHLCRVFRLEVGRTPMAYLKELRIERAKTLLRSGATPVSAIASHLGFTYPHHFSRVFKARTGSTPAQFRSVRS